MYLKNYQGAKFELEKIPNWLLRTAHAEHFAMPEPTVYGNQADLYRKLSWVTSACENVAKIAAPVPFVVKKKIGEDERDIINHDFESLLDRPNPLDSRSELLKATIIMYMLNGNAYWWLNRYSKYTPPEEIWYIPPHMIVPNPDGNLYLKNYLYYPGTGEELTFEPWEIVHFKRFNPFSRFVGLSAIEAIALIAFGDIGMASWNARLFKENNGRLPGMITFDQFIGDDVWDIIKEDMDEAARKRQFLMLRGVGVGGVNWYQNAVSQREMEFLDGRKMNRDEIWNVLAPGLISYLSENATEANSRTGESAFERLSVFPILDDMGQKISNQILPIYQNSKVKKLIGRFKDIRSVDQAIELEKQKQYEKSHTVEEVRKKYYQDDKLGDERDEMSTEQFSAGKTNEPQQSNSFEKEEEKKEITPGSEAPPKQSGKQAAEKVAGKFFNKDSKDALDDLDRFKRKALKSISNDVPFESDFIPKDTMTFIHEQLKRCFTDRAVKAVFSQAREEIIKTHDGENESAKLVLAESVNKLAQAISFRE